MVSYSQNEEDLFVKDYFGDYKGTLLSVGENDGETYSNAKLLIDNAWKAHLVEPGRIFTKLKALYESNINVFTYSVGLSDFDGDVILHESGCHIPGSADRGLVSSIDENEIKRWPLVQFDPYEIEVMKWDTFYKLYLWATKFDFISLDAEGYDWKILQQIDLESVGCKALCVEWNGDRDLLKLFTDHCRGFKIGLINAENIIFIK